MKGLPLRLKYLKLCSFILLPLLSFAQDTLTIVDESGLPLIGVQVYSEDYQTNRVSDIQGKLVLPEDLSPDLVLTLSYTGFKSVKEKVQVLLDNKTITMTAGLVIDEVVVIGRTNTRSDRVMNKVTQITARQIQQSSPQTSADALGQHSDVYIQKSQMGGGSPVIRGFEANRVLLVVDGVRMNNAIYRSGHLQNAITIDNQVLERIEVIYGPGSLKYGSDALGGVVHFRSKYPHYNFSDEDKKAELNLMSRFASTNQEKTVHADLSLAGRSWALLSSVSFVDYNDLLAGSRRNDDFPDFGKRNEFIERVNGEDQVQTNDNPNLQVGTAYSQLDVQQKLKVKINDDLDLMASVQFSTSSDIPRYDQLLQRNSANQLRFAEWNYGPQERFLSALRATYRGKNAFFDQLLAIAAYQRIGEDRIDRDFQSSFRNHQEETVDVFSLTLDFTKQLAGEVSLDYGFESNLNRVSSVAYSENITNGSIASDIFTRYPDGDNRTQNWAAYALLGKSWKEKHHLSGGLRYTFNQVKLQYERTDLIAWPENFTNGLDNRNPALTGSLSYRFSNKAWTLRSMLATAFRAPNIDDLAKIRVRGVEVSVPNLDLEPENSLTGELSVARSISKRFQVSGTTYYTRLSNAIVRRRGALPDGRDILIDGTDTLLTFINANANQANVYGVSLSAEGNLNEQLSFFASWSWIRGRQMSDGIERPQSHIPPAYGRVEMRYKTSASTYTLNTRFNGSKPLSEYGDSQDNPELATAEGALAWYTINLYTQHQFKDRYQVNLSVENILDQFYRPFASGVAGPGRNWILSLSVKI